MADQITPATPRAALEETTVREFKASLQGEMLRPGDDGFDAARMVWNGLIDKTPALIVRCAGVADVICAVHFARANQLLVAVRGGGHSLPGYSTCERGIVIDLSQMKGMHVDPVHRRARAEAGLTWGEFDRATQAFGLATTGGVVSTTGIAGLTLGGGIGWLMRKHGLACDNLLSVDLVTADGRFLTASAMENQDLFWAVRGGGGNFGIVTSFEYQLHPVGPVLGGQVMYPLARAGEVLRFYREFTATAPDELTAYVRLRTSPDGVPVAAIILCYDGSLKAGEEIARPLHALGPPLADLIRPMAYTEVQTLFEAASAPRRHHYYKSDYVAGIGDDAIDTMIAHFALAPSPLSAVGFEPLGGAVGRVGIDETAFRHRAAPYAALILATWTDAPESSRHIQWAREAWTALRPFSTGGVYVNYLNEEEEDRVKAAYGANHDRLVALKNTYDPTNLFRLNQNIKPTL